MKILLTGASGVIGTAVLPLLIGQGHQVTLLSRPAAASDLRQALAQQNFTVEILAAESSSWAAVVEDRVFDACLHLAWIATPGIYLQSPENEALADHTLALAGKLFANGTRHFIGTGTCIEYTPGQTTPCHEETTPAAPVSPYGIAKNCTRIGLERLATRTGNGWTWVRIFYPYGRGEHPSRTASTFLRTLAAGEPLNLKTGGSIKDFIELSDVASALSHLLDCPPQGLINLGTGTPTSIEELATLTARLTGIDPTLVKNTGDGTDPYAYHLADTSKLRATGWAPSVTLEQGLQQLIHSTTFQPAL